MYSIAILNQKGGAGKTTLAAHIGAALSETGLSVLFVDSDAQGSLRDWSAAGTGEIPVIAMDRPVLHQQLPKLGNGRDVAIIDGTPRLKDVTVSAIKAADLVIIPVNPSPLDLWAASDLVELVKARADLTGLKCLLVLNRADARTKISVEAKAVLEEFGLPVAATVIHQRIGYASSMAEGGTVLSVEPNGLAANEIRALAAEIALIMKGA